MRQRLYKGDHPDIAQSLNNLASLLKARTKFAEAESKAQDALRMIKGIVRGDHPHVAICLSNLAGLYQAQGKLEAAEPLFREALGMTERLFDGDHPAVVTCLNNLAALYHAQGKLADAETLYRDSLKMSMRLFDGDHPDVALGLSNLGTVCEARGRYADAEKLLKPALEMRKRLYKGDHPDVALDLTNLGTLFSRRGKIEDAVSLSKDGLDMYQRLFKEDHAAVADNLNRLAVRYQEHGKLMQAAPLYQDALAMSRRLVTVYARQKAEGEALTLAASLPFYRDCFLSCARARQSDPAACYTELWADKGSIARVYEQRQYAARVATDPKLAELLVTLAAERRRRAELLVAPVTQDPATIKERERDLADLDARIASLHRIILEKLPATARTEKLAATTPASLQKILPVEAAVVDFLQYTFFEFDSQTDRGAWKLTSRYLAFVLTRDKIAWTDLGTAEQIDEAVNVWREAIVRRKQVPAEFPNKVRNLVWEKVGKELPANIKTFYICPDATLCKVPWAALPGAKPGTILLEEYAIATIPHVPFLLDKLLPQDPRKNPPTSALVVGGVKYDAELAIPTKNAGSRPGDPLVKSGANISWDTLPGTALEANGVFTAAERKKLSPVRIEGDKATAAAILTALPQARFAHLATHGFFADPSFRFVFQLDEKEYKITRLGERVGRAANSPLVMTGLVFAGANNPKTPGHGVVTGEHLIDLDLSGLELAVLSACDTGLGDVAGGEGIFGLQRAFHYAGTRNVVASLWKVPDQSTAAIMALFYRNLWERNLTPMESLRQAQLEIYRNPGKIAELAKGFHAQFGGVPDMNDEKDVKPVVVGNAHPRLWAAFVLSGPGL